MFPENALTQLLNIYKAHIPKLHNQYLIDLRKRVQDANVMEFMTSDPVSFSLMIQNKDYVCRFRETHFNFVKEYILKREKVTRGSGGANATSFMSNQLESVLE